MSEIMEIKNFLKTITEAAGKEYNESKIQIVDRGIPHIPKKLPNGFIGIYMFKYKDIFIKIGKVGTKSSNRFQYQHYNPQSANSNLALDILADSSIRVAGINETNVGDWLKTNTHRIDILIDENLGMFTLNFYEASLQYKYRPKYEGFKKQKQ